MTCAFAGKREGIIKILHF